jgi:hypothetical protein
MYVAGGTGNLNNDIFRHNIAAGAGSRTLIFGLSTGNGGSVNIDGFTQAHITNNIDSKRDGFNNIFP